ncbi:hypothetical protein SAMN05216412_1117 [Nitrosospira multiformis]|jgi:hypothetical protein|uniref:Heavy-metal-associated domain-containing protein n=1 Tax=Nitrosospira multiformis TaxID=1231 RepID=A0A1I0FYZ9_9PROT|nr:hypothetical protein [Nitrosospira multiformis]SET63764.1 hypothetical protein SAMN05216412_1117 [Nitrosospira multiformis]
MAHYIHHVPGRLRVNTPLLKKNEPRARQLKSYLEGVNGILQIETSIVTGSVVIRYDRCLVNSTLILNSLYDLGYIQHTDTLSGPAHGTSVTPKVVDIFVQKLMETALERSAMALVAALI